MSKTLPKAVVIALIAVALILALILGLFLGAQFGPNLAFIPPTVTCPNGTKVYYAAQCGTVTTTAAPTLSSPQTTAILITEIWTKMDLTSIPAGMPLSPGEQILVQGVLMGSPSGSFSSSDMRGVAYASVGEPKITALIKRALPVSGFSYLTIEPSVHFLPKRLCQST